MGCWSDSHISRCGELALRVLSPVVRRLRWGCQAPSLRCYYSGMCIHQSLRSGDEACGRLLKALTDRGIEVSRATSDFGRVEIRLTETASGKAVKFGAPLNLWTETPEATIALAADIALRRFGTRGDFDLWLRLAGYGSDREELRGSELRRARLEADEADALIRGFTHMFGAGWRYFFEEAIG